MFIDLAILFLGGILIAESEKIYRNIYKLGGHNSVWFPNSKWYISNNWKYENKLLDFVMKYLAAPFKDGFHLTKSAGILLLCLVASEFDLITGIIFYVVLSFGFTLRYHIENGRWS